MNPKRHKREQRQKAPPRAPPSESPLRYEPEWPTRISPVLLFAGIIVIIGMFAFCAFHWRDEWGPFGLMEGLFACAIIPVYFLCRHYGTLAQPMGKARTGTRALTLFMLLVMIQFLTQINLTITTYERALYYCMAPFAEEFFFRGFLCGGIAGFQNNRIRAVLAVGLSTVFFAAVHVSYYGNVPAMAFVTLFGIAAGIAYLYWKDLNAVVLAHFILNFIVSWQILYKVVL